MAELELEERGGRNGKRSLLCSIGGGSGSEI